MNQPVFQPVSHGLYWHVLNASRIATRSHGLMDVDGVFRKGRCWWKESTPFRAMGKMARAARFAGQMIPINCSATGHGRYGNGHEWPWIKSIKVLVPISGIFWVISGLFLGNFWFIGGPFVHFAAKLARSLLGRDQWPVASELVTHFHPRQRSNGCLMQVLLELVIHNMCV